MLKTQLLFQIFMLLWSFSISSQNSNDTLSRDGKNIPFNIYKDTNKTTTINDIVTNAIEFKPIESITEKTNPSDTYWVKLDLRDEIETISKDSIWYLKFRSFGYSSIFYSSSGVIKERQFGNFENKPKQKSIMHTSGIAFSKNSLIDNRYLYIKFRRVIDFSSLSSLKFAYISKKQADLFQNYYSHKDLKKLIPIYLFIGICLVMFLFTLLFFFNTNRIEFLFYALYVLGLFLYLTPDAFKLHDLFFGSFNLTSYTFYQASQVVINMCYVLFTMYYLNTKENYSKLHKPLKYLVCFLALITILDIVFLGSGQFIFHIHLLNFQRLVISVFGLFAIIYFYLKQKNALAYFVVFGSLSYMIGALGYLFTNNRMNMILGCTIEIFIFASGLAYKIRQEHRERLKFQHEALINKTKALRAQINPHFIFNSLSSIQNFITSNKRVLALKYLSKFSRLTRNILESSIETNVVLSEEIDMLKDYLELEALRFDNAFNYEINVNENLDINAIEIPFMVLQPFVENAIIHGLLPKKGGTKLLTLNFKKEKDSAICEIEDNGVGRIEASKKQHIHKEKKKSRGLQVTLERLKTINFGNKTSNIEIIDLKDNKDNPIGTKIIIKIPI